MAKSNPDFQLKCQIIQQVQLKPLLYNKGHPKYQITSFRNEEFAHISISVGKTGEQHKDLVTKFSFIYVSGQKRTELTQYCFDHR